MSQRYIVMALDRLQLGHPNYWRAGRSWPSGQEVEVEVLDQAEDPMETVTVKGEAPRVFPHPTKIGRDSWAKIVADKQLIKQPVGATVNEALALQATYDAMKAELGRTVTRAEMAERALAERNAGVDRLNAQLDEERTKIADLEEQVESGKATAEELHNAFEAAKAKITEMEEQLTALAPADESAAPVSQPKGSGKGSTKRGG